MKWIAISGSWRNTTKQLEFDVDREVRRIIAAGYGVVTGGALGVDYLATQIVCELNPNLKLLKVILPAELNIYKKHYQKRAREGVITRKQATGLINQLEMIKSINPEALIDSSTAKHINQSSNYARNAAVINNADEVNSFSGK